MKLKFYGLDILKVLNFYKGENMARKNKHKDDEFEQEDETTLFDETDDDLENLDAYDLEKMVNKITSKDSDETVTIEQLHVIVEWIKRLL